MDYLKKKRLKLALKMLLAIYSIALAAAAYANWTEKGADFKELVSNWRHVPIVNISVQASGTQCPTHWYPVNMGGFPGTVSSYCECDGSACGTPDLESNCSAKSFWHGECNSVQTTRGCVHKTKYDSLDFDDWKDGVICVLRMGDAEGGDQEDSAYNALNRPRVFNSGTCPANYHRCESTTATTGEFTCALNGYACPITTIAVVTNADTTYDDCLADGTVGATHKFCFAREGDMMPRVKFVLAENRTCFPGHGSSKDNNMPLVGSHGGCSKADSRWAQVDKVFWGEHYTSNNVPQFSNLDWLYADWAAQSPPAEFSLDSRQEIVWTEECPRTRQQLNDKVDEVDLLTGAQLALLVVNVIIGVCIGICFGIWEWRQKDESGWADDSKKQRRIRGCKLGVTLTGALIKLICVSIAIAMVTDLSNTFNAIKGEECSEPETNETLDFFADETREKQLVMDIFILLGVVAELLLESRQLYKCYKSMHNEGAKETEKVTPENRLELGVDQPQERPSSAVGEEETVDPRYL